jgi:hypothetical protein
LTDTSLTSSLACSRPRSDLRARRFIRLSRCRFCPRGDIAPALLLTRADYRARHDRQATIIYCANHAGTPSLPHSCEPPLVNPLLGPARQFPTPDALVLTAAKRSAAVSADFSSPSRGRTFSVHRLVFRWFQSRGWHRRPGAEVGGSRFQQNGNRSKMSGDSDSGGSRCSGLLWL